MIRILLLSLATLLIFAEPALADPISGLIAAGKALFATKIGAIIAQVAISTGLSLLAQRLRKKPKQPGLQNQFKGRGGTEPGSFILGRAAVKGHQTYHNSQGDNSKWYHEVLELCDLPGATLERLIIDGEYSDIGPVYVDDNAGDVGNIIVSKNKDNDSHRAFIRLYDGTQTAADPMLVSFFAASDRRWTTDHKLQGICYAVLSYYFDRKRFPRGVPELSFEMLGIPVYDPRKDTSVGGSGAHRWADPATWEQSENLVVLAYNILRGIAAPGGGTWGGDCDHEDLPMANWVAAMNACDIDVDGRKKYTGGIEARWTDEPRDIIDQLLAGCNGQITELGGVYRVQVDAPATAVVSLTDDDFSVSDPSELMPFPGLEGTFNGGTVTHPDPAQLWNASAPHTVTNTEWETQDGTQRLFDLQLPTVFNSAQAKQLLNAAVNDGRRFRRHKGTLPPDLFWLDTLSTFAWSSEAEGYSSKLFEISEIAYDLFTFNVTVSVRERDPSDFPIIPGLELPGVPTITTPIIRVDAGVPGFYIQPVIITVEDGPQRPAFKLGWDAVAIDGNVAGIAYELRLVGATELAKSGSTANIEAGSLILSGDIIPDGLYEARPRALSAVRDTLWDNWVQARAPNVGIGADAFWAAIDAAAQDAFDRLNTAFQAAVDRTEAGVMQELVDRFLEDAKANGKIETTQTVLKSEIDAVSTSLTENYMTAVTTGGALAQLETDLTASIDTVQANVNTLASSLATTDQAVASLETSLLAEINGVEAWAAQTFRTEAQVNTAISDAVTSVETELNGLSTDVTQVQSAVDGIEGVYGVKINNNGVVSGFGLISQLVNGSPVSDFIVDVNNFYVGTSDTSGNFAAPFSVSGGVVYAKDLIVRNANIQNAAITTLKIFGGAVSKNAVATGTYSASTSVTLTEAGWVTAIASFTQGTGKNAHRWRLNVDGTQVQSETPQEATIGAMTGGKFCQPGTRTVIVSCDTTTGDGRCGVTVFGLMR